MSKRPYTAFPIQEKNLDIAFLKHYMKLPEAKHSQ